MIANGIARLIGEEVTGLSFNASAPGGNVFVEHLPKTPIRAVAVYSRPGPEASSLHPYDEPHVQIVVRGDEDPVWAVDMWWAIYTVVHSRRNEDLPDDTHLVYALVIQSGPVHMSPDENGRFRFSMNIRTEIYNPTEQRSA